MDEIYLLNIQYKKINSELCFADKETAEKIAFVLEKVYGKELKLTATIKKLYTKDNIVEDIIKGLNFGKYLGPN